MFNNWQSIGPSWVSEKVFRVLEVLKENRIPARMPSDDMFFFSPYHLPHPMLRWEIQVRRRDRARAAALLAREGLIDSPLQASAIDAPEAETCAGHALVPAAVH